MHGRDGGGGGVNLGLRLTAKHDLHERRAHNQCGGIQYRDALYL